MLILKLLPTPSCLNLANLIVYRHIYLSIIIIIIIIIIVIIIIILFISL